MDLVTKDAISNLLNNADQHFNQKNFSDSKKTLDELLEQHPNVAEAWYRLALIFHQQSKYPKAIEHLQQSIKLDQKNYLYHYQLGLSYQANSQPVLAAEALLQALLLNPQERSVLDTLISELNVIKTEHPKSTFAIVRKLSALYPQDSGLKLAKANLLKGLPFVESMLEDPSILDEVYQLLEQPSINSRVFAPQVQNLILSTNNMDQSIKTIIDHKGDSSLLELDCVPQVISHPLLLRSLKSFPLTHPDLEKTLVKLRYAYLKQALEFYNTTSKSQETPKPTAEALGFLCHLCQQAWLNEYIYYTSPEEIKALKSLHKIIHTKELAPTDYVFSALVWFSYCSASDDESTLHKSMQFLNAPLLQPVFNQYRRSQREMTFQKHLKSVTEIQDKTSKKVRSQYEESPYPRWINVDIEPVKRTVGEIIQEHLPHFSPQKTLLKPARVLVAGCGSGYQAINLASCCEASEIIAIDLSSTSLSYAKRMAEEFDIPNIQFVQADLLELADNTFGKKQFDYILASGVLHHLQEPLTGWKNLVNLLKPKGAMLLGLYSKTARKPVLETRKHIKEQGIPTNPDAIRKLRFDIIEQGNQHPLFTLSKWRDFFTLSECRDLVFHVKEHQFTIPQIKTALEELSLKFLGFQSNNLALTPGDKATLTSANNYNNLDIWHEFEQKQPDLFYCMYNFFCQKK